MWPGFAQHDALAGFAGPFVLGDEAELRHLFRAEGFGSVQVQQRSFTARFPEPERLLAAAVNTAAAGIPQLQRLHDAARDELRAAISGDLQPRVQAATVDDHVVLPMYAHIARAHPPTPRSPAGS